MAFGDTARQPRRNRRRFSMAWFAYRFASALRPGSSVALVQPGPDAGLGLSGLRSRRQQTCGAVRHIDHLGPVAGHHQFAAVDKPLAAVVAIGAACDHELHIDPIPVGIVQGQPRGVGWRGRPDSRQAATSPASATAARPVPESHRALAAAQNGRSPLIWVRCMTRRVAGSNASRRCMTQRLSHRIRSPARHC